MMQKLMWAMAVAVAGASDVSSQQSEASASTTTLSSSVATSPVGGGNPYQQFLWGQELRRAGAEVDPDHEKNTQQLEQNRNQHRALQEETAVEKELRLANGPWEDCLGMQAEECVSYIESVAADMYCVVVYPRDYDHNRVWIRVNWEDEVVKPPARG